MGRCDQEIGLRDKWVGPFRIHIGILVTSPGYPVYSRGHVLIPASFITTDTEMLGFETASLSAHPGFSFSVIPLHLPRSPSGRILRGQEISIDPHTIGDVLIGKWDI